MSTGSPLATPQPWSLVSSAYAAEVVPMFEPYARDALRLAAPPAGSRIVDVACGPGTLAVLAARSGHRVDALDFSPAMIAKLEARIAADGITGITPRVGDGQALPYPDGEYAAAFSMFGLMFFPDRARGYAELRRVLAPGGRAVVSSWHPLDAVPAIAVIFGAIRELMSAVVPAGPGPASTWPAGAAMPASSDAPLTTADACRDEMSAAFTAVEVHAVTHTKHYESTVAMWESIERTLAPLALLREKLGPERWAGAAAKIRAALVSAIGEGPQQLAMPAWLAVGVAA